MISGITWDWEYKVQLDYLRRHDDENIILNFVGSHLWKDAFVGDIQYHWMRLHFAKELQIL